MNDNNVRAKVLFPNTYGTDSTNISYIPKEILCLESGEVQVWPIIGTSFTWNSKAGEKLSVIHTRLKIVSGQYVSFFPAQSGGYGGGQFEEQVVIDTFFLIDENEDNFTDENMDYIVIR